MHWCFHNDCFGVLVQGEMTSAFKSHDCSRIVATDTVSLDRAMRYLPSFGGYG
jgi:urate oxidase